MTEELKDSLPLLFLSEQKASVKIDANSHNNSSSLANTSPAKNSPIEPELPFTDITFGPDGKVYYRNTPAHETKDSLETIDGHKGKIYEVGSKRCLFKEKSGNFFHIQKVKEHNMAVETVKIRNITATEKTPAIETLAIRTVYDLVMPNGRHYSMLGHINREAGIIASQISSYNENISSKDKIKPSREFAITLFIERKNKIVTQTFQGTMHSNLQNINPSIYSQFLDTLADHGITLTAMEKSFRENALRQSLSIRYKASSLQLSENQPSGIDYRTYVLRPEVERIVINAMNKVFDSKLADWHSKKPSQRLELLINEAVYNTDKKPDTQLISAIRSVLEEGLIISPTKATQYFKQLSQHDEDFAISRLLIEKGARWQSGNNDQDILALGNYGAELLIHLRRAEASNKLSSTPSAKKSQLPPAPQPSRKKGLLRRLKNIF